MRRVKNSWIKEPENSDADDYYCCFVIRICVFLPCPGAAIQTEEAHGLGWAGRRTTAGQAAANRSQRKVRPARFVGFVAAGDGPLDNGWPHDDGLGQSPSSNGMGREGFSKPHHGPAGTAKASGGTSQRQRSDHDM